MRRFEITYLDSREGDLRRWEGDAEDWDDAYTQASEDYYFGKVIQVTELSDTDES